MNAIGNVIGTVLLYLSPCYECGVIGTVLLYLFPCFYLVDSVNCWERSNITPEVEMTAGVIWSWLMGISDYC